MSWMLYLVVAAVALAAADVFVKMSSARCRTASAGVCGLVIWNEPLTPRYAAGVLVSMLGVYLIATR